MKTLENGPKMRYQRTGIPVKIETRADGKRVISGYAAVFFDPSDAGTAYRMWDDVEERILPGAFDLAIREDDVRGLFNHDMSAILGRTTAGTCRLSVDAKGLKYEIDPPDTACARDLLVSIERGDVNASSFGFMPESTNYREEVRDGVSLYIIERVSVRLFDVSPVTFPAYQSTTVGLRADVRESRDAVRGEVEAWKQLRGAGAGDAGFLARVQARLRAIQIDAEIDAQ
jgi:uncharacterized protein